MKRAIKFTVVFLIILIFLSFLRCIPYVLGYEAEFNSYCATALTVIVTVKIMKWILEDCEE